MDLRNAYFIDGVRTWFGKARQDGFRALCYKQDRHVHCRELTMTK